MEVCFGRGLAPLIAAVRESALLAVAAGVGILAAMGSWRRLLWQEWNLEIWQL